MTINVANETPYALYVNDKKITTLFCSALNLEDLVTGYLLTNSFILSFEDILSIQVQETTWRIDAKIIPHSQVSLAELSLYELIKEHKHQGLTPLPMTTTVALSEIVAHGHELNDYVGLHKTVGGVHLAMISDGKQTLLREDISRRYALDKVIGAAVTAGMDLTKCHIITSGRVPLDMLLQLILLQIPVIGSFKIPSGPSVELAEEFNLSICAKILTDAPQIVTCQDRIISLIRK